MNTGKVFVRNNPDLRNMTAVNLRGAIQDNPNLLKKVMFFGSKLRGSKPYWQARCGELLDMVKQIGAPTLFVTLSAAGRTCAASWLLGRT